MAKPTKQIQREAMGKSVVIKPTEPLSSIETRFYLSQGLGSKPKRQQLIAYLRKVITDNGATPRGNFDSDLLKQALVAKGITPVKNYNQNWQLLMQSL